MSIWADQKIREILDELERLKARISALEASPEPIPSVGISVERLDKRTKEYKEWKNANS